MKCDNLQKQKSEWKRKGWSIPDLRGSKQEWFSLVSELVQYIGQSVVADISLTPMLKSISSPYPWRTYVPFLKGVGLITNHAGVLVLSDTGRDFAKDPSKITLAGLLHDKYRLFGELLDILSLEPRTIEEIDAELCRAYSLDWANLSNTRRRMDWLEVLGMVQNLGNRKWGLTTLGQEMLNNWLLVTPDVVETASNEMDESYITPPAEQIGQLLEKLKEDPALHNDRNTYNVWVPSPNRIENLRTIVQFSWEKVSRQELFTFIEDEFSLKASSVESMMPFLKADGLLEEVGRNVYVATAAAKEWCANGNDLDFIRIIHSHKRFVGEMIAFAKDDVVRNDVYAEAKKYGLNTEKARWVMGFLLEAGLLEETQYLHIRATPLGLSFIVDLPLANEYPHIQTTTESPDTREKSESEHQVPVDKAEALFVRLSEAARDPMAEGKASGVAFEEEIAAVFRYMGFDANRIGGPGNTDVVVRWKDDEGKVITAIVDGKSKSSGTVTHTDISDVAIETHKEKNDAEYVAIIGPGFGGDTIKNHARKKGFALITDTELIDIAKNAHAIGLSLSEISTMFKVPNGIMGLNELISTKNREKEIITLVVSTFRQEQDAMDSLSARDLYFLLRGSELSPSLKELLSAFDVLAKEEIGLLKQIKKASSTENTTYSIQGEKQCINQLRSLANAIEKGLS